jgi:hypoxanthine phosphoribosyltransferase
MPKRRSQEEKHAKLNAERMVSIPKDVVLSPQAEPPRGPLGQDRSAARSAARELTWSQFERRAQSLARTVRQEYAPDAVVGVAHGGVFVGGALAKALGVEFFPVRISRRSRDRVRLDQPKLFGEMPKELKGRRVLVVDDVASSGDTLELAAALAGKVGAREVKTCTLIARPEGFTPGWTGEVTEDFVVFPWDYDLVVADAFFQEPPPAKKAGARASKEGAAAKGSSEGAAVKGASAGASAKKLAKSKAPKGSARGEAVPAGKGRRGLAGRGKGARR